MQSTVLKYTRFRLLVTSMILVIASLRVAGQSYILTRYTSRDGIAHDNVREIVADSSGFIWMATWDGLTRYDGTEFINYAHDPADSTTIPYFSITNVVIDSNDDLWVCTDNGVISLFNRSTEEFRVITSIGDTHLSGLISFSTSPEGKLCFALTTKFLVYDPKTGEALSYRWSGAPVDLSGFRFGQFRIIFQSIDHIWLTGKNVIEVELSANGETGNGRAVIMSVNSIEWLPDRTEIFFGETGSGRMTYDTEGNMWLAAATGLFRHDRGKNVFREYDGNPGELNFADTVPLVFYSHHTGLYIWFPDGESLISIPRETCGLPTEVFFYGPDILWFSYQTAGSTPAGIIKVLLTPYKFTYINPYPVKNSQLNVFGITRDSQGGLWIASRDRNYLIRIRNDGTEEKINILDDSKLARLWHPRAFLTDDYGVWIGYYNEILLYYNLSTGHIEEHSPSSLVHTMCFDPEGRILIADNGIIRYDPATRKSERLLTVSDSIGLFTLDRDGDILWAGGSANYLLRYDLSSGRHEFIKLAQGITNIEDICQGVDGELWIATLGTGVCKYNPSTGSKQFFTTSAGLSNNTTYSILRDPDNNIWVSTNAGISVINPGSGLIRSFGENDGLVIHEFNSDAAHTSPEGMFLFGGVGGVVEFDPAQVLEEHRAKAQNNIIINELEVSALRRYPPEPIYKADTLILEKGDDNFHISFVAPEYRHPEKIRYRYRLDGESDNWYYTSHSDRNINFSNLSPGWYKLEIQATDINGSWGNPKVVTIHLKPFFYQTTGFLIALPVTVILLLSLMAWTFIRQIRQREQQKRDALRHQALRGQMNPHFIFNSLNSINYFISNNDRLSANRYIADFSKLIRTVLNNMNEEYVRLSVELESLEDYMKIEHLRFGDKFDYSIEIDPEITQEAVKVSPGLIQPFIENAIWHGVMGLEGRKGMIRVALQRKDSKLVCIVEDDGVGRERSEAMKDKSLPKRSKGIALAIERLKIVNSLQSTDHKIRITDLFPGRLETGTRVEIEMPVT